MSSSELSFSEKVQSIWQVFLFQPVITTGIGGFSSFAAVLEGIGLSFLLPIVEIIQSGAPDDPGTFMRIFLDGYELFGIPFNLKYVILGASLVLILRYTCTFLAQWLQAHLRETYVYHLRVKTYDHAMDARIAKFDRKGSDEILNSLVTESKKAGNVILRLVNLSSTFFMCLTYILIAIVVSPLLALLSVVVLGGITIVLRNIFESGSQIGNRVADANEDFQEIAQVGAQGIREAKLYTITDDLKKKFGNFASDFRGSRVTLLRNMYGINQFFRLSTAIVIVLLIYFGHTWAGLSLSELGIFLFSMFRLAPLASRLNKNYYHLEGELPHLVRTQEFQDKLTSVPELSGDQNPPEPVENVIFDNVSFSYDNAEKRALNHVSIELNRGEFIAIVGPSGAGKSTIYALLTRFYDPDEGVIRANGTPIQKFDLQEWRKKLAVVRQTPFIFNDTLAQNIALFEEPDDKRMREAGLVAEVEEFVHGLPNGYETVLGDRGTRLSGGQKQRVALARALYREADVLMLDEATSDLDTSIERNVHTAIENMNRDIIILTIAHRLSTVINADRIYTIDNGEVVQQGEHQELLQQENGLYAELYASQTS